MKLNSINLSVNNDLGGIIKDFGIEEKRRNKGNRLQYQEIFISLNIRLDKDFLH